MKESNQRTFQKRLITAMTELALSQSELSRQLGVAQQTVQQWCVGKSQPRMDLLDKLAEAVNKPVHWFFMPIDMDTETNSQRHNQKTSENRDNGSPLFSTEKVITLSPEEQQLIHIYRDLPGKERKEVLHRLSRSLEVINNLIDQLYNNKEK